MPHPPSLLLIVKWGGELTPAGKVQAEELGKAFRTLYPGGQGMFYTLMYQATCQIYCSYEKFNHMMKTGNIQIHCASQRENNPKIRYIYISIE